MWVSTLSLLLILLGCTLSVCNKNVRYKKISTQQDTFKYLTKYGYNPCSNSSKRVACSVDYSSMLRVYQKQNGLKVTGIRDTATLHQMNRPRCGNLDSRAAKLGGTKWSRSLLTWSLRSHPEQISRARATAIIRKAFNVWLAHIPLQITETCESCSADIVIESGRYQHGCSDSFDGRGQTLAHAFFPEIGKIHFDSDEPWTESFADSDINFYLVAVHEIGHALGLEHNFNEQSIMYPSYNLFPEGAMLPDYDRQSIQAIYGASDDDETTTSKPGDGDRGDDGDRCDGDCRGDRGTGISWKGQDWANGCDFIGNDFSHVQVAADQCGDECNAVPECTHFTWTRYDSGTCYLKKGRISKSNAVPKRDQSMVCGVASNEGKGAGISWKGQDWANGCDFIGNDLSRVRVAAEHCGGECNAVPECTHFTWTRYDGGTCFLKKGRISKSNAVPKRDRSMVCGVAN